MIEEKPKYLNPRWVDKENRLWCEILVGDKYHQCNINVVNPDEGLVNKDFDVIMEMYTPDEIDANTEDYEEHLRTR